jgi:AcrR family transcriptional regulator
MNKKELLLQSALELFVQNGFHGTATAKIAKEAGVANGTLFQYFATKEDLIIALFISIKEEMAIYIDAKTELALSTKEKIQIQITSTIYWGLANATKFHFVQQIYASPYIHQIGESALKKYIQPHYVLIEQAIKEKMIKPMPTELLYTLISSQAFGLHQFLISNKMSKPKQQTTITTTVDMLWQMISI